MEASVLSRWQLKYHLWLAIVLLGALYLSTAWNSNIISSDVTVEAPRRVLTEESFLGAWQEDPALVSYIRSRLLLPPSDLPYNLSDPQLEHFSQLGQSQYANGWILRNMTGGFFVEVGALDGEYLSNTLYFERQLAWSGLLIEAFPTSYSHLLQKNRKVYTVNAALSHTNFSDEVNYQIRGPLGVSGRVREDTSDGITVKALPFWSILQAVNVTLIDFLSMDIEGSEVKVLRTIPWDKLRVRLMCIECVHLPEGMTPLVDLLTQQGYFFIGQRVMVVVLWQNWGEHVGRQLPHFLAGATLTDVTITVGPRSIKAHRIILAFFSPFFKKMLEEVSEERPMVLVFPGVNFDALQVIIAYMYRGQVNVAAELLPHVIELAKMLKVKGLIELPAQLDSVITGSGGKVAVNHEEITPDDGYEGSHEICLENKGVVELEVTADDPDPTVSCNLPEENHENSVEVSAETQTVSSSSTLPTEQQRDEEQSHPQGVTTKAPGVQIKATEVRGSSDHVLIQPEDIQLSTVDDLTPTHIVKLNEDGTMDEVLFSRDCIHSDGTNDDHTSADDTVCLQEGQESSPSKKRKKMIYKLARYGPADLQRAIEDVRSGMGTLREIAERWGVPHSTLSVNARMAGISVQQRNLDYDSETLEAAKQAVKGGSSYMKVAREYNIPKSVLWRRCQREGILRDSTRRLYNYSQDDVGQARQMILEGSSLSQIVKETKIPKTTLFRLKEQLVREGKMPASCINRLMRPRRPSEVSLQQAVVACKEEGMSQGQASEKYQVSKSTVWRRLKRLKQEEPSNSFSTNSEGTHNVKIEVVENIANDSYDEEITMRYAEDGELRYVEAITDQSQVEKTLEYEDMSARYNTSGSTEKILHRRDESIQDTKIRNSKSDSLEVVSGSSLVANEGQDIVIATSQSSTFMKSEHLGLLTNEGHMIHGGAPLTITQEGKITAETDGSGDGSGNPQFELEMPLMNLPSGGYKVVGSEIVIGGQQMVVLEPPGSSQHHQNSADHHHLVVASFSQVEELDDLSKVERKVSVENVEAQTQQEETEQTNADAETS